MEVFYVLNLFVFIFIGIYKIYYLSKKFSLGFINPIVLSFIIFFPIDLFKLLIGPYFLLDGGLFNPYFNYAILMTTIYMLGELLLISLTIKYMRRKSKSKFIFFKRFEIKKGRMKLLSNVFLFLALISFIILSNHSFGVINWLKSPRTGYQLYRNGMGLYYALCVTFLSVSYVLKVTFCNNKKIIFNTILYIVFVYFLGSKGFILSFFTFSIVALWLNKYKYLNLMLITGGLVIGSLMLYNFYSTMGSVGMETLSSYFDYYVNSAKYFEEYFKGNIPLYHGKVMITNLWSLVPRNLYPEKPYVYGILHINEYFWPGAAEKTNTPAFGGPIFQYADFGFLGLIVYSLTNISVIITTVLYYLLYNNINIKEIQKNSSKLIVFIWLLAPSFLSFFLFPLNVIFFIFIWLTISIGNRIVIRKGVN